ncbi:MAG: ABC transporter ATP-binding protein [Infirmifilum sp.]
MGMVELEGVTKSYGKNRVLEGISLSAEKNEFLVVLGASGEGKSTILNIISGVVRPDKGRVVIDGEVVDDSGKTYIPPEKRDIGYVFQNYALYPHMTAFDNIAFPLRMRKLPENEVKKRVLEVAEMLRISHVLDHKPSQLSGGQQQRVAVARAIVKEPKLLLMDEPFSNIDPALRDSVRWELKVLVKKVGITTIMATHDQEEAMSLADRVALLRKGRFIQYDAPEKIYEHPVNAYVAEFIGGMNVLPLNDRLAGILQEQLGVKVSTGEKLFGFRPEHTAISDTRGIPVRVLGGEFRGEKWVYVVDLGLDRPAKIFSQSRIQADTTIRILPRRLYFFGEDESTTRIEEIV